MILQHQSLDKLKLLINEETKYRSGPELVRFFNELGFSDTYGQGFPSRASYTNDRLARINGTPELDKCIKNLFAPVNFIGRIADLDGLIKDFNQYLAFDKWKIVRDKTVIALVRLDQVELDESPSPLEEDEFLQREFQDISIKSIGLAEAVTKVLELRVAEIEKCLSTDAPLSVIFLAGSTLEGVLLGIALEYPKEFNQSRSSPKDKDGKARKYPDWTLSNFIDVAHEVGLLSEDVRKYSHTLRDFRNYIHPYEQMTSRFNPDKHTARISWQVLKAALFQLSRNRVKADTIPR